MSVCADSFLYAVASHFHDFETTTGHGHLPGVGWASRTGSAGSRVTILVQQAIRSLRRAVPAGPVHVHMLHGESYKGLAPAIAKEE